MEDKGEKQYVLITGASCGLGKELANECAKRGMNLLLTALPNEEISELGKDFSQKYGVEVNTFEADLTKPEELKGTGVSVSVAHPGGMRTNAEVTHSIENYNRSCKCHGERQARGMLPARESIEKAIGWFRQNEYF